MGCIHKQEIDTAASWHAADFVGDQSWLVHFTDAEIAALDHAVAAAMARSLRFPDFGKDDFPLAGWAERLQSFADELENGRGFFLNLMNCANAAEYKTLSQLGYMMGRL